MNNIKETVDKYLLENFEDIEFQRLNNKDFRWQGIADNLGFDRGEYIRHRFAKIRKKIGNNNPKQWLEERGWKAKEVNKHTYVMTTTDQTQTFTFQSGKEDKTKGTKEFSFTADNIPTEEEIIEHFNIDTTKFRIAQIWHKTSFGGKYSISVSLFALKGSETITIDQSFIDKLNSIHSMELKEHPICTAIKPKASLVIPKQDSHFNKFDINGANSIDDRFAIFTKTLLFQLENVTKTNNLEEIVYIIGSDEFNSEWTEQTTHGTPQSNILSYQQAFEKISEFNIEIIKLLRFYTPKVKVMLLNGNHDHNVSWHLASLLKQVFKKNIGIEIDSTLDNTKIYSYSSNLVLLNHGDKIKPKDLAAKFPIIAKEKWSQHSNFYCLTGDKHHEVAHDFNGIMWYQVPQLSTAISNWDDKMGFITSKAELLTFLFEEDGLSNILRKQIK